MKLRNLLLIGALGLALPFTQGCTNQELAIGTGLVAIGAIGVIAGAAAASHNHHGGWHNRRHRGWGGNHRGWGHHRRFAVGGLAGEASLGSIGAAPSVSIVNPQTDAAVLSSEFHLSPASASKFVNALDASRNGDASALEQIGLSPSDMANLAQLKPLSANAMAKMSASLNQNPADTQAMVSALVQSAKADLQNVHGYVWSACISSGQWKTPENMYCTNTYWSGCSPATGATACLPAR